MRVATVASVRGAVAGGIVLGDNPWRERPIVREAATEALRHWLHHSAVWMSADLPPPLRGHHAVGQRLPSWIPPDDLTGSELEAVEAGWDDAVPRLDRGVRRFLRLRVEGPEQVAQLRAIGDIDGLVIAPSLDSAGSRGVPLRWRWPVRVGVLAGQETDSWLATLLASGHAGHVYDAEAYAPDVEYEILIVSSHELDDLDDEAAVALRLATCVVGAGEGTAVELTQAVDERIRPNIAVGIAAPPDTWWRPFFWELCHDVPIDAALELMRRAVGVDALIAGPEAGMDVTASARWFAAVAPDFPELARWLDEFAGWDWNFEDGGATRETTLVRDVRAAGGDPVAVVEPPRMAAAPPPSVDEPAPVPTVTPTAAPPPAPAPAPPAAPPTVDEAEPRRLVTRVWDGEVVVSTILPPGRELRFGVRVAIPEAGDVAADQPVALPPQAPGPTIQLEVAVRSDAWDEQPAPQPISISRDQRSQPSTWAVFALTTPAGGVVEIEIVLLYQGKPLQAATYVSPVRTDAVPGERPTLTTFRLSGPDEPSDHLLPVDVTLDGRGAELRRVDRDGGTVLITDVQAMLDRIEDRVSRVLGVVGAPDSFDDPRAVELLIALARIGVELGTALAPLGLDEARSINILVNADTRVLPLELVYGAPAPRPGADVCRHVDDPPPPGEACTRASTRTVCPYAFWGLHRSVARTVVSTGRPAAPPAPTLRSRSLLYAATVIADDGAVGEPTPSVSVLEAARSRFGSVDRVTSWTAWRRAIKTAQPNLLVVLGHTMKEGGETNLYIGRKSALARPDITAAVVRATGSPPPLVLLIACATAVLGDPFGSLPGVLTARGAGAVVATLSKIVGPHGATATVHLLRAVDEAAATGASVGEAVAAARRSLITERRPIGLMLVSHGEVDTRVVA